MSSSEQSLPSTDIQNRSLSFPTPTDYAASCNAAPSYAMASTSRVTSGATVGIVSPDEQRNIDPSSADCFDEWLNSLTEGNTTGLYSLMNGSTGLHSSEMDFDYLFFDNPPLLPDLSRTADKFEIFNERMKQIQQQWPVRFIDAPAPPPSLWYSIWMADSRNLIADSQLPPLDFPDARTRWR